jgi:hypothetical protein
MRFHDVRHTTATLLLKAGVPIQHVQRILRHANVRITVDTYGHLANEDLRAPLELLPKPSERALPPRIRILSTIRVAPADLEAFVARGAISNRRRPVVPRRRAAL